MTELHGWHRLAAIARYYWDTTLKCISCCDFCHERCDICSAPRAVKVKVDQLHGVVYQGSKSKALYHPEKSSAFERVDEKFAENHHQTEWNTFFHAPTCQDKVLEAIQGDLPLPNPNCTLMDVNSKAIPELTTKDREFSLKMLEVALKDTAPGKLSDSEEYIHDAVEMEFESFQSSKMVSHYKYTVLKKMAELYEAANCCILFPAPTLEKNVKKERPPPKYKDGFCPLSQMCPCLPEGIEAVERKPNEELLTTTDIFRQLYGSDQRTIPISTLEMKQSPAGANTLTSAPSGNFYSPSNGNAHSVSSKQIALLGRERKVFMKLENGDPKKSQPRARPMQELKSKEQQDPAPQTSLNTLPIYEESEPVAKRRTEAVVEKELGIPEEKLQRKLVAPVQAHEVLEIKRSRTDTTHLEPVETKAGGSLPKNMTTIHKDRVAEDNQFTSKKDIAEIVMKYLNPFFREGRFGSKELFKGFARELTHFLYNEKNSQRLTVKEDAHRLIKKFFKTRSMCESETDWQGILRSCPP